MADGNGDRLNRQIKASEAYANLSRDIGDLKEILIEVRDDLKDLKTNPMVKIGVAFKTGKRAAFALVAFAATCIGIGASVRQILGP